MSWQFRDESRSFSSDSRSMRLLPSTTPVRRIRSTESRLVTASYCLTLGAVGANRLAQRVVGLNAHHSDRGKGRHEENTITPAIGKRNGTSPNRSTPSASRTAFLSGRGHAAAFAVA